MKRYALWETKEPVFIINPPTKFHRKKILIQKKKKKKYLQELKRMMEMWRE